MSRDAHVPKFAITGGPCGGKSTGIPFVAEKLSNAGYKPFIVDEAATLLIKSGMSPALFSNHDFQGHVIDLGLMLEDSMLRVARTTTHPRPVLLCDRGTMDAKAYTPKHTFAALLKERDLSIVHLRDRRYDAVFHLRSAAVGAEAFYTQANNVARREGLAEARAVDEATLNAWIGHPHLEIIENEYYGAQITFEQKLIALTKAIFRKLGIPEPLEIERKYLIDPASWDHLCTISERQEVEIDQFYVPPIAGYDETRFRKRTQHGESVYVETCKREVRPGVRVETEHFVTRQEYELALQFRLPGSKLLRKRRICFVHQSRYLEYDVFETGLHVLEVEIADEHERPQLPGWLKVIADITNDPHYSNRALAGAK